MLPLVPDPSRSYRPGWATYADDFSQLPDVEYICGGINDKRASAAAVWRQGNLLHFGFDLSPAEMNQTGQALLLNCIAYISRFTEDRPIAITPSVFSGPVPPIRFYPEAVIRDPSRDLADLRFYLAPRLLAAAKNRTRTKWLAWWKDNEGDLAPPPGEQKLDVDRDAKALNAPLDRIDFFTRTLAALSGKDGDLAARARRLLERYAPEGPKQGDGVAWKAWFEENRDYLFFTDAGGYRWYIDPLARKRHIPSARLRGAARASSGPAP